MSHTPVCCAQALAQTFRAFPPTGGFPVGLCPVNRGLNYLWTLFSGLGSFSSAEGFSACFPFFLFLSASDTLFLLLSCCLFPRVPGDILPLPFCV